jgi:hypothetical protein
VRRTIHHQSPRRSYGMHFFRLLSSAGLLVCATVVCSFLGQASAHGQSAEGRVVAKTNLLKPASTSPKSTCANFLPDLTLVCIYMDWSGAATRVNLFQITSRDGILSWSAPIAVTNDPGDEYDPFISFDSTRNKLLLVYAKWHNDRGGDHNDVVIRSKDCVECEWSAPVVVAADGVHDYWIPSLLILRNGAILTFYTRDGPESNRGRGSGRIELRRSTDGGKTWNPPIVPTQSCDAEYPRAIQNSHGSILLAFSKYIFSSKPNTEVPCSDGVKSNYPYSDIHQVWSSDNGATWTGESVLYHSASGSALHPFIISETVRPQTPCPACAWDLLFVQPDDGFSVFQIKSRDEGISWNKPARITKSSWMSPFNVDPGLATTCNGLVANYTSGYGLDLVYSQRLDALRRCQ